MSTKSFIVNFIKTYLVWVLVVTIVLIRIVIGYYDDKFLRVAFLDVGQGDAILIITPDKYSFLVDTGPPGNIGRKIDKHLLPWQKLDGLLLTHPDLDHIGNAVSLINSYQLENIHFNTFSSNNDVANELWDMNEDGEVNFQPLHAGDEIRVGCCVVIMVIWPTTSDESGLQELGLDSNSSSLSVLVSYGMHDFLLTGDLDSDYEELLAEEINSRIKKQVEVLKLGHHGSNTSTSMHFLEILKPNYAVVQSGLGNSYGHPHKEVLANIEAANVRLYRNDQDGEIIFRSNGIDLEIN